MIKFRSHANWDIGKKSVNLKPIMSMKLYSTFRIGKL